ncbi:hypothetical protein PVAP13_1NG387857 [Panicum virgatum]|uniref:Uncharacterized protein n=1 Tax=Panicum virgatum TaxID=38727 RepID=A0A8T0X229_PANVG|nr:hypothetical protein PVAP13_1NG387857 [Panicum virgatum]
MRRPPPPPHGHGRAPSRLSCRARCVPRLTAGCHPRPSTHGRRRGDVRGEAGGRSCGGGRRRWTRSWWRRRRNSPPSPSSPPPHRPHRCRRDTHPFQRAAADPDSQDGSPAPPRPCSCRPRRSVPASEAPSATTRYPSPPSRSAPAMGPTRSGLPAPTRPRDTEVPLPW